VSLNEIKLILSYAGAFGVGGIVAGGIVFYLLKSFIPSYISEKGKNLATREDIAKITNEIEGVKSQYAILLQRQSRIHEHQVEILAKLYKSLFDIQVYSQHMTRVLIFAGENRDAYPKLLKSSLEEAYNAFTKGRLFLPLDLAERVESFFKKVLEGQLQFGMAQDPMVQNGQQRAQLWDKAATIAHKEMPALLRIIEDQARSIIHDKKDF
jgi:hypothetical protein